MKQEEEIGGGGEGGNRTHGTRVTFKQKLDSKEGPSCIISTGYNIYLGGKHFNGVMNEIMNNDQ